MLSKHLTPTSRWWAEAWDSIPGDKADCCPDCGEAWQYMGSYAMKLQDVGVSSLDWHHEFRHRCGGSGKCGARRYVQAKASDAFNQAHQKRWPEHRAHRTGKGPVGVHVPAGGASPC